MQAWLAKFAHVRKAAEQNPAISQSSIPGFEPAPPSQFIMGAASSREVAGGEKPVDARNCEAGPDRILGTRVLGWLSSLSFGEPSISLTSDEQRHVQTRAEEMQAFREKASLVGMKSSHCATEGVSGGCTGVLNVAVPNSRFRFRVVSCKLKKM